MHDSPPSQKDTPFQRMRYALLKKTYRVINQVNFKIFNEHKFKDICIQTMKYYKQFYAR